MRFLALFFVVLFAFASCKKAEKTETAPAMEAATEAPAVPQTANVDVNAYLQEFNTLLTTYKEALAKKDTAMLSNLSMKYTELAQAGMEAAEKATGEDKEKMLSSIQMMSDQFKAISEGKK